MTDGGGLDNHVCHYEREVGTFTATGDYSQVKLRFAG
jgi:hypothetical protein